MQLLFILVTIVILCEAHDGENYNWTTCEEFGKDTDFHPNDIVDNDWVPFYMWSLEWLQGIFLHKFSHASFRLLQLYQNEMLSVLNRTLDSKGTKLCMTSDIGMLLVPTDQKGEFEAMPYARVPSTIKLVKIKMPVIKLRLKMVGPYLALTLCDHMYAVIMAVSGTEPTTVDKIKSEAATLMFQGPGYPIDRDSVATSSAKVCYL